MLCDAGVLVHDCARLLALCTGCSGRASCASWCLLLEHTHGGVHNSCFAHACFGKAYGLCMHASSAPTCGWHVSEMEKLMGSAFATNSMPCYWTAPAMNCSLHTWKCPWAAATVFFPPQSISSKFMVSFLETYWIWCGCL